MENMDRMMAIQEERLGAELNRFSTIRDRIITSSKQVYSRGCHIIVLLIQIRINMFSWIQIRR